MFINAVLAAPSLVGTTVDTGSIGKRLSDEPADLVLLYGGEQDGVLGDCGCPSNPRGGLGRIERYAEAVRDSGHPPLLLNAGNWLTDPVGADNGLRADAVVRGTHMASAIEAGSWSALNVGFRDAPWLGQHGTMPGNAVSANVSGPGAPAPYVVVEVEGRTVAITGVTAWAKDYLQPEAWAWTEPVPAVAELIPELRAAADLVVVLSYGLGRDNNGLAALDIDVLVEADGHRTRMEPLVVDDTVWVRSSYQTQLLGELRLKLGDGGIEHATNRAISLDERVGARGSWRKREKAAERDVQAAAEALFGP